MNKNQFLDLSECTEFGLAVLERPPRIVHGAIVLLVLLLVAAAMWATATKVDLIVRASGQVRPMDEPVEVFNSVSSQTSSVGAGRRVIEVNFSEGEPVHAGDVLVRLDTERLENEIARRNASIRAAEEELVKLSTIGQLQQEKYEAERAKVETELSTATKLVERERQRQQSAVRVALVRLRRSVDHEKRSRGLAKKRVVTAADLVRATADVKEARENLLQARLPLDQSKIEILGRGLEIVRKDFVVRQEELKMKQDRKRAEMEALHLEIANFELERGRTVIVAPLDGIVIRGGDLEVGDIVEAGKPVATIARHQGFRLDVAVPSEDVTHLHVGKRARVKLDAYDFHRYGTLQGKILFISPDSKQSQSDQAQANTGYTVRIALEGDTVGRGRFSGRIKLGMTGRAEIVTRRERAISLLWKSIRHAISLG